MENLNVTRYDKGVAKCPFNPHANITTLMTENGQMFVGSPTDFSGSDPAILRADVSQVCYFRHSYCLPFPNKKYENRIYRRVHECFVPVSIIQSG